MHNVAPVTNGGSDEIEVAPQVKPGDGNAQQKLIVSKWASLWRIMVLSSLGLTFYPYCRYIRALDLRDLKELFEDFKFRADFSKGFFDGTLSRFRFDLPGEPEPRQVKGKSKAKKQSPWRLMTTATMEAIGNAITKETPMLEELDGEITSRALLEWIPRLSRLQQMTLWNGAALVDGTGNLIHIHCPNFKTLRFYEWPDLEADSLFATFLQELRPQSLEALEVFSYSNIGAETFLALNCHNTTLQELKLNNIKPEAMGSLSMLKGCTALTSLLLTETTGSTDLESTGHDTFLEVIGWLRECTKLRTITFQKFLSGPAILTPVLLENYMQIVRLEVTDYITSSARDFHQALAHQQSLRSIVLKGDAEGCEIEPLVEALSQLTHLKELRLSNLSDFFLDYHICKLAQNLRELEELWISGWGITDAIWADISNLRSLRRLDINALSSFTLNGLLDYIYRLGAGNWGLALAVMMADPESSLTEEGQSLIRETLAAKVEGRFDYTLARDPDAIDYSESDSD
ncbi:hypothetical protein MMC30_000420 [Trapelia coarctata]|nr:hypothetical protein [Trapelia coarctata]